MLKKYYFYIFLLLIPIFLTSLEASEEKAQDNDDNVKEVAYSPLTGHTSDVNSVAISQDSRYIVSGSMDKTIGIWDFKTDRKSVV